jgi:DNA repair protein RadD
MKFKPRAYQQKAVAEIRQAFREGKRRLVLVSPTGAGKSFMASVIIEGAVAKGNKVVFLAHRKELIEQCSKTLDEIGVDHGVIKANHWRRRPDAPVQVASVQTLVAKRTCKLCKDARIAYAKIVAPYHEYKDVPTEAIIVPCDPCQGTGKIPRSKPPAQILVIDETHRCLAASYLEIVASYPNALLLGLTATPIRRDGRGLGRMYEQIVATVQVEDLVDMGFLLPLRVYAPDLPDLSDVKLVAGDYDNVRLAEVMRAEKLVGNIIDHWQRLGENRRTIVFTVSVENSKDLARRFRDAGVVAEHVDGTMAGNERYTILGRLASGETTVVTNVDLVTEGYDLPSLGCVVLARPTKSLTVFLQQVGRVMRPHADQTYAVVLDHAGCVHEHGLPTHPRRWTLDDRKKKKGKGGEDEDLPVMRCESCGALRPRDVELCPACSGVQIEVFKGIIAEADGQLVEFKSAYACEHCNSTSVKIKVWRELQLQLLCNDCKKASYVVDKHAAKVASEERRRKEFERLRAVQREKGFRDGWVSHNFRKIFGVWPPRDWHARS